MPSFAVRLCRRLSRDDRTRGVAAVEAAIVLPLVVALFVGIVEFGLIFKDSIAISAGVRAGGRFASAEPLKLSFAGDAAAQVGYTMTAVQTTGLATLYVYDPTVTSDPRTACSIRCNAYLWSSITKVFGATSRTWTQCAAPGSQVGVMLSVQHRGLTSAPFASPTLVETAIFKVEPADSTAICQ